MHLMNTMHLNEFNENKNTITMFFKVNDCQKVVKAMRIGNKQTYLWL